MRRRRLLGTLGAGTALLAGCISRQDRSPASAGGTRTTTATGNPTATGTATTEASADDGQSTDGDRTLAVARVETFTHALRLNDLGKSPAGSIPSFSDLDDREREAVDAALADGYETADPSDWLVEFLSGTPFVKRDDEFYRIHHTLPRYTINAEPTTADDVDGEIASNEEYREAVTHDGVVTTGLLRLARSSGVTLVEVWSSLRAFLDTYNAVRYRGDLLAVSVEVEDPGPPYVATAEPATLDEVARRSVWDAEDAPQAVRSVLREAGRTGGLYPLDDPPDGLLDGLDDHELVYLDGRFYTTYVEKRTPLPVSMTATAPDPALDADGATLRLVLRNDADEPVQLLTGAPRPFSILRYHPVGEPDSGDLLWTDAYEESEHVFVEDGEVTMVQDIGLSVTIGPGDEVARTFTVRESDLPAGEYVVEDDVGVEVGEGGEEGGSFPYRVVFRVE